MRSASSSRLLVAGVVVATALMAWLFGWPGGTLAGPGVDEGKAVFTGKGLCLNCHGASAEGGFGPALAGRQLSAERVLHQLRTPFRSMPSFRTDQISDDEAASIAEFLSSLEAPAERGKPRVEANSTDPDVKQQWAKKGCAQCHGAEAGGVVTNWAERGATPLAAILKRKAEGGRLMPAFREDQVSDEQETAFHDFLTGLVDSTYPVSAGVTATRSGTETTFTITVRNNIADQAVFIEVKGVLPKNGKLVDSWAGSGRGFQAGRFDGTAVGWINTNVGADRTQGPFVFIVDTGSEPAAGYAWVRYITAKGQTGAFTTRPATASP